GGANLPELSGATQKLRKAEAEGRSALEALQQALGIRAEKLRTARAAQVAEVEVLFNGGAAQLSRWCGDEEKQQLHDKLENLRNRLQTDRLLELEGPCHNLRQQLEEKLRHAQDQE